MAVETIQSDVSDTTRQEEVEGRINCEERVEECPAPTALPSPGTRKDNPRIMGR